MSQPAEDVKQFGPGEAGIVRRWLTEIQISRKNSKDWREESRKIWNKYKGTERKKNAFNILWSNTEVLRPAIYNSLPQPDVRRRYADADPMGKCVSDVMERALQFAFETSDFNEQIKADILDTLLPGRGVSRVRYIPSLVQVGDVAQVGAEDAETEQEHESQEGAHEELAWEQVAIDHIQWDDLQFGPGKTWNEVCWIAFRHDMTREQIEDQFGEEIASRLTMNSSAQVEVASLEDGDPVKRLFDTCEVWEIWDKDEREVLFVADAWKQGPLKTVKDPLRLSGFFPIPKPLYAIEDSTSTTPIPPYSLYREQAEELDRISIRINKIVDALKVRGLYDATLGNDISQLIRGADNDLVPATDVAAWIEKGGIEKAIWFMPIEQAAAVVAGLYAQREQCKQVIYELTGISDIIRGATDASETATAQVLKHQWGTIRLQRMQKAAQDYIRDLVRLMGEVIAEHFSIETLAKMTGLDYPTDAQLEPQRQQYQQAMLMAMMQGQPPPPPPQFPTTWEQIKAVLSDDMQRTFKVDIETDSTIAATIEADVAGLAQTMEGITKLIQGLAPMVQAKVLPFEAAKELVLMVCRRTKMGSSVEDAFEKMTEPPPPPPDPKTQVPLQIEQMRQQGKQAEIAANSQADQLRAQLDAWVAEQQQQAQQRQSEQENAIEAQREAMRTQNEAQLEQIRLHVDGQLEALKQQNAVLIAQLNNRTKIEVAEIAAGTQLATAQIGAANQSQEMQ